MPLMEEKTGFGSFRLSGQTLRPLRELFHATVAAKPQRFFTTVPVQLSNPVSKIIWFQVSALIYIDTQLKT
jgi:hypothetical protein